MQVGEHWLRSIVDLPLSYAELAAILTQAGIEVEAMTPSEQSPSESILSLKIPPNRGDCLGLEGLAREIVALVPQSRFLGIPPTDVNLERLDLDQSFKVAITEPAACPHYQACILESVNNQVVTPAWMRDRLKISGLHSVSVVVDILNYVMLELGQPLHAFDVDRLEGSLTVRKASVGESVTLVDGRRVMLDPSVLVIADQLQVQAMAGIMGATASAVGPETQRIILESAYFDPVTIRMAASRTGVHTDASYRFERGVDPLLAQRALSRAIEWLVQLTGAEPKAYCAQQHATFMPQNPTIFLAQSDIQRSLGIVLESKTVCAIFEGLNFQVNVESDGYSVCPPSYRFDLQISADLIEELARVYGLDRIPAVALTGPLKTLTISDTKIMDHPLKECLAYLGYFEIISYSFIATMWLEHFPLQQNPWVLKNPISSEMSLMRPSLWPGLLKVAQYNQNRQQKRLRLFECGHCFQGEASHPLEIPSIAGLISGSVEPEQWGLKTRGVDFYDLKGDVEALLRLYGLDLNDVSFQKTRHPALDAAYSAEMISASQCVGYLGMLHPKLIQLLDLQGPIFVFEINRSLLKPHTKPLFKAIAKFPSIRRDIALFVDQAVAVEDLRQCIIEAAGPFLQKVFVFDVYQNKTSPDPLQKAICHKSIAFGLIFQDQEATLEENQIKVLMDNVCFRLKEQFQAVLRDSS